MIRPDETKFVLHGLDIDNRVVRAAVFIQKLRALVQALQAADRLTNGKKSFEYMISKLEMGSAAVVLREKKASTDQPKGSGIALLERTATAIYNSDPDIGRLPDEMIRRVQKFGDGISKTFSHAELGFERDNIIRIDDFLIRQANIVTEPVQVIDGLDRPRLFRGTAIGSFDGVLKEIDARGTVLRGKLVLTAGDIEVDCVMNKDKVPAARNSFDRRVYVDGIAHYDGESALPTRIDVSAITAALDAPDILRWRGSLMRAPVAVSDVEDEW